jgi:hypothetical protein
MRKIVKRFEDGKMVKKLKGFEANGLSGEIEAEIMKLKLNGGVLKCSVEFVERFKQIRKKLEARVVNESGMI